MCRRCRPRRPRAPSARRARRVRLRSIAISSRAMRRRRDPGRHRQLVGGDAGVRGADDPVAGAFPCVTGGGERERLAGAGGRGEHVDAVARLGHRDHRCRLFVRQPARCRAQRREQLVARAEPRARLRAGRSRCRGRGVRCRAARTSSTAPGAAASRSCGRRHHGSPRPCRGRHRDSGAVSIRSMSASASSSIRSIGAPAGSESHHAIRMSLRSNVESCAVSPWRRATGPRPSAAPRP